MVGMNQERETGYSNGRALHHRAPKLKIEICIKLGQRIVLRESEGH